MCERGTYYEDDPYVEYFDYQCQDGSKEGTERGYFEVPTEEEWPRCLYNPVCPEPPLVPFEGSLNISRPNLPVHSSTKCQVDGNDLSLVCPSFLKIHVK